MLNRKLRFLLLIYLVVHNPTIEYTKEQQLYRTLVPLGHILLTFFIRIGTFDCLRVSGLVQVFQVSCIVVTRVCVHKANMDH